MGHRRWCAEDGVPGLRKRHWNGWILGQVTSVAVRCILRTLGLVSCSFLEPRLGVGSMQA